MEKVLDRYEERLKSHLNFEFKKNPPQNRAILCRRAAPKPSDEQSETMWRATKAKICRALIGGG